MLRAYFIFLIKLLILHFFNITRLSLMCFNKNIYIYSQVFFCVYIFFFNYFI